MNINKLKGKIVERGMNIGQLADLLRVDRSGFYRKFKPVNADKMTLGEAARIKTILGMSNAEAADIFFNVNVACGATEGGQNEAAN